jgi:MFS family permease
MDPSRRIVLLLACCQALLLTNAVTLIAVASLVGYVLAANKALATLPSTAYVIGAAITAFPASMWMRRVGRRNGFLTGGALGLAGAMLATFAVATGSFALLCAGMLLLGSYNSFGQYYRFAAADASPADFKPKAISYVLAGGLAGGIIGPEVSRHTRGLMQPEYAATFGSLVFFSLAAMAILAFLRMPPAADSRSNEPTRKLSEIARQPAFIVAVSVAALGYAVMNLLMTATPLAMTFCGHPYDAAAGVIASHVVAMFAPSFFTGTLIKRFGVVHVMLAGVCALLACVGAALAGQQVANFWWALVLLGVGWNFTYIGGSTLLTEAYRPSEKAKVQGTNEITVFGVQALSSLAAGVLVNTRGWTVLNYVALPLILFAGASCLWLYARRRRMRCAPTRP